MSERQIITVREELVTVTERNRNAGWSYKARTAETWYEVEYSDGTKDGDWYLWPSWKPYLHVEPTCI